MLFGHRMNAAPIARLSLRASPLAALFALAGCAPTIDYEARPLPPRAHDPQEECYYAHRMELSHGESEWQESSGAPVYGGYTTVTTHTQTGITFYNAGERLDTRPALQRLGDPELARVYAEGTDKHAGAAKTYAIALPTTFVLLAAGLVGMGVATYTIVSASPDDDTSSQRALPPLLIGTGLVVGGAIAAIVALVTRKSAFEYHIRESLFIEQPLVPRLEEAMLDYNRRAAAGCGYGGPVDVPLP